MADINDYIKGLNYKFTEQEKLLMNIFAECWEHCNNRNSCTECEYANGNKNIKMLICISYQYAKRLIAADVQEVVRCKDCIHCCMSYDPKTNTSRQICGYVGYNPVQSSGVTDYDFCSKGERMIDSENNG